VTPFSPDREVRFGLALALEHGLTASATFRELVERHGSAAEAFHASVKDSGPALSRADDLLRRVHEMGATVMLFGEPRFPECLCELAYPPSCLFVLGDIGLLDRPMVSIVGTRQSSSSGERAAYVIAGALARAGACVVSGMALGIDAAAHRGALDAGGSTIAVLASGVDRPYPPSHEKLHARIVSEGAAISETASGAWPGRGAFPRRNRIIAALGRVLIVVEAGTKSGALITANHALELGRHIGAVPGSVDSPRCVGTNSLLRNGAVVITGPEDALLLAGLTVPEGMSDGEVSLGMSESSPPRSSNRGGRLGANEAAIVDAMRSGAADVDSLVRVSGLSSREVAAAITALELTGTITTDHGGGVRIGS
jgi:DNA processing protein